MPSTPIHSDSIGILMIFRPKDNSHERYVVLNEQPRLDAASTSLLEIPAGILDDNSGDAIGKATRLIKEQTSITVQREELINMTALATDQALVKDHIVLLLWEKTVDRRDTEQLKCGLEGHQAEDGSVTVRVRGYDVFCKESIGDAKTNAARVLYEKLSREGKLDEPMRQIRTGCMPGEMVQGKQMGGAVRV